MFYAWKFNAFSNERKEFNGMMMARICPNM